MFQVAQPKNTTAVMTVRRKDRFETVRGTRIGRIYPLIGIIRSEHKRKGGWYLVPKWGEKGRYGLVGSKEFATYYLWVAYKIPK